MTGNTSNDVKHNEIYSEHHTTYKSIEMILVYSCCRGANSTVLSKETMINVTITVFRKKKPPRKDEYNVVHTQREYSVQCLFISSFTAHTISKQQVQNKQFYKTFTTTQAILKLRNHLIFCYIQSTRNNTKTMQITETKD